VLPDLLASDPDRLARFTREAQTLAALNHPHIAQIHGLEDLPGAGGGRHQALVMELVPGHDLAERVGAGALPLDEVLSIARQVAEALEAAHDSGIVHRDLKPANIRLRPDGTVKVLDFGLAKAMELAGGSGANLANSPTLTARATQMGMLIGTAAYMAPEQARGKPVDKRADIWAFGCTVYELLAGRSAFPGESVSDTIAKVLEREPDWTLLPPRTPPHLRDLLERCLRKDPSRRLRDIGEARVRLEEGAGMPLPTAPARRAQPAWLLAAALAAALTAGVAIGTTFRPGATPSASSAPVHLDLVLPDGTELFTVSGAQMTISPDGSRSVTSPSAAGRAISTCVS
jgi:serine/threonine protein kinase